MERSTAAIDTVEQSLLAAIVAAPASDAPRLVYADWLQARGELHDELHGQLIVAQCELAKARREDTVSADAAEERGKLAGIEASLLAQAELTWLAPFIEQSQRCFGGKLALSRGLLPTTAIATRAEHLLRWHAGLERFAPFVTHMCLLDLGWDAFEQLLACGSLHRFRRLELRADRYGHQVAHNRPLAHNRPPRPCCEGGLS